MTKTFGVYGGVLNGDTANTALTAVLRDEDGAINTGQINAGGLAMSSGKLVLSNETLASSVSVGNVVVHRISGAYTFALPPAAASSGQVHIFIKTDTGTVSTIDGNASETINGALTLALTGQYQAAVLACDGSGWNRVAGAHDDLSNLIADPGNAGAIPVIRSGCVPLVSTGAETRTLAAPSFAGQQLSLAFKTDGGDVVLTCASGLNQTGNNTITFNDAGDVVTLLAIEVGSNLRWRVQLNDGATLATV